MDPDQNQLPAILQRDYFPALPDALLHTRGRNRPPADSPSLQARDDREAILAWLARVAESDNTRQSYLKEADRFYRWAVFQRGCLLSSLTHEDMELYRRFLADPQPAALWVNPRRASRQDPAWRPFSGPLGPSSVRQALIIINAMFSWLVEARYLAANPLSLARKRRGRGAPRLTRLLDASQVRACFDAVDALPAGTALEQRHVARCRWMLHVFLACGLRISEAAGARMGDFYLRSSHDHGRWWLDVMGKGSKARQLPVNEEMLLALQDYRVRNGLSPLPSPGEALPLLLRVRGPSVQPMTRQAIHLVLKAIFARAATRLRDQGRDGEALALEYASAHWLRHTAGSMMGDAGIDIRTIQSNLGHNSLDTTSIYLHRADDQRHDEMAAHTVHAETARKAAEASPEALKARVAELEAELARLRSNN